MAERNQIYKCNICGNIVDVLHGRAGELVCCGEPMKLQLEKTKDEGSEKHVPMVEKTKKGFRVKVGETEHPMEENHFIEWIEVIANGKTCRKFLKPEEKPEAEFCVQSEKVTAREYCNVHGLWSSQ